MAIGSAVDEDSELADEKEFSEINITPFVDVVLVLLVIFIVTAPAMMKDSFKVNLPKTLTSDGAPQGETVGVAITALGQFVLSGQVYDQEQFKAQIIQNYSEKSSVKFLISADSDSKHGDLVFVIDTLKKADLNQYALQIEKIKSTK
jgi:biopolymer transport protein ExbD